MRPAFRRGWEGEGKPNRRPGAGQRARSDRHTGAAILLWEREGKALGVLMQSATEAAASLNRIAGQHSLGPDRRCETDDRVDPARAQQPAAGNGEQDQEEGRVDGDEILKAADPGRYGR